MSTLVFPRLALVAALTIAWVPMLILSAACPAAATSAYFKGKVLPLAKLLEKIGSTLDPDASPHWLALITDDGKIYPLIKDDGSRIFFNDAKVQNRSMRITGRLFKDTHLLQVLDVHSYVKGQLNEIYYWCDICAIRRRQKQICDCCGGPMVLKEVPAK